MIEVGCSDSEVLLWVKRPTPEQVAEAAKAGKKTPSQGQARAYRRETVRTSFGVQYWIDDLASIA